MADTLKVCPPPTRYGQDQMHCRLCKRMWDIDEERPHCDVRLCDDHPDRVSITNLDGDEMCHDCADAWVRSQRGDPHEV